MRSAWIWIGLALALGAKILTPGRPERAPNLWMLAFLFLPFAILTYWAHTHDSGPAPRLRALRAALFAFLVVEAFYFGGSFGGLAAAAGACVIFLRFIRPPKPSAPG